jgi:hypothetical protein
LAAVGKRQALAVAGGQRDGGVTLQASARMVAECRKLAMMTGRIALPCELANAMALSSAPAVNTPTGYREWRNSG